MIKLEKPLDMNPDIINDLNAAGAKFNIAGGKIISVDGSGPAYNAVLEKYEIISPITPPAQKDPSDGDIG